MRFLFLAILLASTSCSAQNVATPAPAPADTSETDVLFRCAYKYDNKYNIEFLERNKVEYRSPSFPDLVIYHITDTKGMKWSINQYEWADFECTKTTIQKA